MSRIILHIDLNAFFASAMQIKFPHLKGKPIAVCGNTRGSVVTTASYEARAYGVTSAMPLAIARQKCPDLEVVETDFEWFKKISLDFVNLLKRYSDVLEQASIDECYMDVSKIIMTYKKPLNLVVEIQQKIKKELGLSCSIGLAPNKFLAKMASDMKKPDGITILRKREVSQKLWPLPIGKMMYVGKKTSEKLMDHGFMTIGDVANADLSQLVPILGNQAQTIKNHANGEDDEEILVYQPAKSISASQSLFEPIFDYDEVSLLLKSLVDDIAEKCEKDRVKGLTLSLHMKFDDSSTSTKSIRNDDGYSQKEDIYQNTMLLFDEMDEGQSVKFVSLTLNNLKESEYDEVYNLFTMNQVSSIDDIIKTANDLLGKDVLIKARNLENKSNEEGS